MKHENHHHHVETNHKMAALVASYHESGLGLKRFARERGIPPGRLHYWIYQKHRDRQPRSTAQGPKDVPAALFQEVKLAAGASLVESWEAEVRLDKGVSVRFRGTAMPGWIGAVIQALQRPC